MVRWYLDFHWPYYLNTVVVLSLINSFEYHQNMMFGLWVIYAGLPLLDLVIPDDNINPTPEESIELSKQFKWKIPVYLFLFSEWYALYFSLKLVSTYEISPFFIFILAISIGHSNAIGFLFSHELFHKKGKIDRTLGTLNMLKTLYMHFFLEHIYGHHKYVSTPIDPATARLNQSLYSFLYQTLMGSFKNSWDRELKKLEKTGQKSNIFANRMIRYLTIEATFTVGVYFVFGMTALIVFLLEAAVSIFILETINYIRHYGLLRKEVRAGEYEAVTVKHSWNAPQWLQNMIFLKLQRHSDHHANSYKPYQCLLSLDESPTLPGGYLGCIPAAMVPPLWYYMINPIAIEVNTSKTPSKSAYNTSKKAYHYWLVVQVAFFTALLLLG